jgi:hypothetical protein
VAHPIDGTAWLIGGTNEKCAEKVGVGDGWRTHITWGINLPIIDHRVSWIHKIRVGRLNTPTRKIASCEKCEKEVNDHLSGFRKGRVPKFNTPTREVTSCKEALVFSPSRLLCMEGTFKEGSIPHRISGISVWRKRSRGFWTHELTSCEKALALRPSCGHMEV